jgi:hypothetical protein
MKRFLALFALTLLSSAALAQTVTLTPSVTSGNGTLSTKLTWSTMPAAQSCTASGHTSWTGTKAASGSVDLPPITLSGTYTLTLDCTWPGDSTATVRWTAPTTNTDGSALAKCANADSTGPCLAYYQVYRRVGSADLSAGAEMTQVRDPNATQFVKSGLGAGAQYFAVEVVNGEGVASALSNVASKTITATTTRSQSVTVTVNPKPSPATAVTVE